MSTDRDEPEELSAEELAAEDASELPARQAMSAIGDIAIPLDPDLAAEVLLAQDELEEPGEPAPPSSD